MITLFVLWLSELTNFCSLKVIGWGAEKASNLAFPPSLILPR
jgi:hypothetical protein